jgi:glycosyltransferase involved in cell wall biosynthesis
MKILLGNPTTLKEATGGAETFLSSLGAKIRKRGITTFSLRLSEEDNPDASILEEDPVPGFERSFVLSGCNALFAYPYSRDPILVQKYEKFLAKQEIRLVHFLVHSGFSALIEAARRLNLPTVLSLMDFGIGCRRATLMWKGMERCVPPVLGRRCECCVQADSSRKQRTLYQISRFLPVQLVAALRGQAIRMCGRDPVLGLKPRMVSQALARQLQNLPEEISAFHAPSQWMGEVARRYGAPPEKIHHVPYGTDEKPGARPRAKDGNARGLVVGYLGRFDRMKGLEVLGKAMRLLPPGLEVEARIHAPLADVPDEYEREVRALFSGEPRIRLLGKAGRNQIGQILPALDALVVPSLWYENNPIVISEAQAHRVPVICSESPGMDDQVTDGVNGRRFPAGDARKLADILLELSRDRSPLGRWSDAIQVPPSTEETATRILEIYRQLPGWAGP